MPRSPVVAPGIPKPPVLTQPARPAAPAAGASGAAAAQPSRPLAGQPIARPVVPPSPEILERLRQTQARSAPGQPAAPRPGMPTPGQPIYPGARRPAGPGRPVSPGPRPVRGRGPHPTTPVLEPPPPSTEARREAGKKRPTARDRELEREGILKPFGRKQEPMVLPVVDKEIPISEGITAKELSEKLGVKANLVIKRLVERGVFATINQPLDMKLVEELCRDFGARPTRMSYEEEAVQVLELAEVAADLEPRPPVVTVMGHVDHGKTSLLDAIRETNVADKEAGGITQHIGAYSVELNGRKVVFIDTPGHEAFTRMRARGAKVTDIVVLVVAADDGVMPQTKEAIDHARAAGVPIIVAVNKIDKPEAQPERVKQQLTELGLMPEEWGGDTPFVPVSAKQRQNIELLLEMILLVADMQELKANPNRPAVATVLEAKLDKGRGPVATVLVRNGTLRVGDYFLCGAVFGKIRALYNDLGQQVREAGPAMPVEIIGLESLPEVGDTLQVVTDVAKARQIAEFREVRIREAAQAKTRVSLEQLHTQLREGETKELNIILKADVGGTAEVLAETLQKLSTEKVQIRVISAGVGAINESDVDLADASNAIIIGFNVRPDRKAQERAEQEKVDIRLHTIIYELTDEIKKAMLGMLEPVYREVFRGRAEVKEIFRVAKVGTVAGCVVSEGVIPRDAEIRLLRDNVVVYTGRIESLKRFKNDASEVRQGQECGMALANFQDIKPGDIIEAFAKERMAPDLGV
jgi:translation initiation factor IF-2